MHLKDYRTSILLGITFTLLLSTFWFMPQLAFIIFISMLLQLLLTPLVEKLHSCLPRALSAGLVLIAFVLLAIGLLAVVSSTFIPTFTRFITDFPQITEKLQTLPFLQDSQFLNDELDNLWQELKSVSVDALKSSLTLLLSVFSKFIDIVIILFVTFYLLKDGELIKSYLASRFPTHDYQRVMKLFNRILAALRTYICSRCFPVFHPARSSLWIRICYGIGNLRIHSCSRTNRRLCFRYAADGDGRSFCRPADRGILSRADSGQP